MSARPEIVVTALGVVSPLGIGLEAFSSALRQPRSGVGPITLCDPAGLRIHLAGEVRDFDAKEFIAKQHRKSLKIMSRSMQMGVVAAQEAWDAAGLAEGKVDPDRVGAVFGADNMCTSPEEAAAYYVGCVKDGHADMAAWQARTQATGFPLGMLRTLPNLVASHVSIVLDARGPNNTHHHNEVSSLMAIAEAMRVIERGGGRRDDRRRGQLAHRSLRLGPPAGARRAFAGAWSRGGAASVRPAPRRPSARRRGGGAGPRESPPRRGARERRSWLVCAATAPRPRSGPRDRQPFSWR